MSKSNGLPSAAQAMLDVAKATKERKRRVDALLSATSSLQREAEMAHLSDKLEFDIGVRTARAELDQHHSAIIGGISEEVQVLSEESKELDELISPPPPVRVPEPVAIVDSADESAPQTEVLPAVVEPPAAKDEPKKSSSSANLLIIVLAAIVGLVAGLFTNGFIDNGFIAFVWVVLATALGGVIGALIGRYTDNTKPAPAGTS